MHDAMPEGMVLNKPRSFQAAHGRGLALALLLSVLAHTFWLTKPSQWLPFSQATTPQSSWTTRLIQASPAAQPSVVAAPAPEKKPAPAASAKAPAPPADTKPDLNENQASAQTNSAPVATETIANTTTVAQDKTTAPSSADAPVAASSTGDATPPNASSSTSVAEQLRLEYPGNVTLSFEGVFARQGTQRKGVGQLQWKSDGRTYDMSLQASYFGITLLSQSSAGSLSERGLEPLRYGDQRGTRSEQAAHFRREKAQIEFSNNKPSAALLPGAQDRLSVILQLAGLLLGDVERHLAAKRITLQVAGIDGAQVWEFVLEGSETVTLPTGQMQAQRLQRKPRDEFDQRLEIWLAAELSYLPVRIKQTSVTNPDTDFTDLVLSKLP
jgi:hypothetical protein